VAQQLLGRRRADGVAAAVVERRRHAGCGGGTTVARGLGHGNKERRHARGRRKEEKADERLK
jgi:hypothetical protein